MTQEQQIIEWQKCNDKFVHVSKLDQGDMVFSQDYVRWLEE
jgi:hypothetical protein